MTASNSASSLLNAVNIRQATPGARDRTSRHPVTIGQPDIQQGHVGAQPGNAGQRGRYGASLADHLDVRLGLQQAADTPADDFVVIQEEHADRLSRRIAGRLSARRT